MFATLLATLSQKVLLSFYSTRELSPSVIAQAERLVLSFFCSLNGQWDDHVSPRILASTGIGENVARNLNLLFAVTEIGTRVEPAVARDF